MREAKEEDGNSTATVDADPEPRSWTPATYSTKRRTQGAIAEEVAASAVVPIAKDKEEENAFLAPAPDRLQ